MSINWSEIRDAGSADRHWGGGGGGRSQWTCMIHGFTENNSKPLQFLNSYDVTKHRLLKSHDFSILIHVSKQMIRKGFEASWLNQSAIMNAVLRSLNYGFIVSFRPQRYLL